MQIVRIIFTLRLTASKEDAAGDLLKESTKVKKCADEEIHHMHIHDDKEEEAFNRKIEDLKNLEIQPDGAVLGKDFRDVILRQMQLTHALFQRQHQDAMLLHEGVKHFTAISKRVERLTLVLIGLTGVLAVMTALLIPR